MKTAKINIGGKDYTLCFSLRVVRTCTEKFGNIDAALSEGSTIQQLDNSLWILAQMIDAGARYDRLNGIDAPKPLSFDELLDVEGIDDIMSLKDKIMETITNGKQASVEVEAEKNAETSRA